MMKYSRRKAAPQFTSGMDERHVRFCISELDSIGRSLRRKCWSSVPRVWWRNAVIKVKGAVSRKTEIKDSKRSNITPEFKIEPKKSRLEGSSCWGGKAFDHTVFRKAVERKFSMLR